MQTTYFIQLKIHGHIYMWLSIMEIKEKIAKCELTAEILRRLLIGC